jgi:hypothetical protein
VSRALAALLLALAAPSIGAEKAEVRRGNLTLSVKVTGTVAPEGLLRLKSPIEGRVENVKASSFTWHQAGEPLAALAHKELAAMLDAKGAVDQQVLEERWKNVYRPVSVYCPEDCYVLKVFTHAHAWVKPQSVLFDAARRLKMIGRVGPLEAAAIRNGMALTYWRTGDAARKMKRTLTNYTLDLADEAGGQGGTFTFTLDAETGFAPGTAWEGLIVPQRLDDVLVVPTAALIHAEGNFYLPVRVSVGMTTAEFTQITGGAEERRDVLVLDDAALKGAPRHKLEDAPPIFVETPKTPPPPLPEEPAPTEAPAPAPKRAPRPARRPAPPPKPKPVEKPIDIDDAAKDEPDGE